MNGERYFNERFYPRILIMEPVPIEAIPLHEIERADFPSCSNPSASPDCGDWQCGGGLFSSIPFTTSSPFHLSSISTSKIWNKKSTSAETQVFFQRLIGLFRFLNRLLVYHSAHDNQGLKFEKWERFSIYLKCPPRNNLCHVKNLKWFLITINITFSPVFISSPRSSLGSSGVAVGSRACCSICSSSFSKSSVSETTKET